MNLYNFTLQTGSMINCSIHGNFSGTRQQEICVSKGNTIELLRPDPNSFKLQQLLSVNVFGVIRCLMPFRLTGGNKDYIIVGSDSGKIVILEYMPDRNVFDKVHEETFGKSGCRRIVPGQFLCVDPKGRAVMIGALEKQRLVYILNRDAAARLTISSPLEAHKSKTLIYDIVGVDNGYDNPIFACLEFDYDEVDDDHTGEAFEEARQHLVLYELDLGLNHVVRKNSEKLDDLCYKLIAVPAGKGLPGGLLLCTENYIIYKNIGEQEDVRIAIPRREGSEADIMIVASTTHKTKSLTFFLLQTEEGDLFKLTLDCETVDDVLTVQGLVMKYLDTLSPATGLCVLRAGFLFVSSEFGNHNLYRIAELGQAEDMDYSSVGMEPEDVFPRYKPRELKNLVQVDSIESLCPITDCKIADLTHKEEGKDSDVFETPQFYMLSGQGKNGSFRTLRHGLEVTEMAVSELPGDPSAVWTVKTHSSAQFHAYIVISFVNATLVMSIGETVEEVTDSGFLGTIPTLSASSIGEDSLLQIHPNGIRHIRSDKRINEWKAPSPAVILNSAVNSRQVAIALTGNDIVYFEIDAFGQLNEYSERLSVDANITSIAIGPVPEGRQRSRFLTVGLDDQTVRVYSLDPEDCLTQVSMQVLPGAANSLCIVEMEGTETSLRTLFLYIGLQNGVMLRTVIDHLSGVLEDSRTRYLGQKPVTLVRMEVQGNDAVLALSVKPWLSYPYQGRVHCTPLSYDTLRSAAPFASEYCPEGIVAIADNTLRIISTEKMGVSFNQISAPLKHTPRKFEIHPQSKLMLILEAEYHGLNNQEEEDEDEDAMEKDSATWESCLRVLDPATNETTEIYPFADNEVPRSIITCQFHNQNEEIFVLVGTAVDMHLRAQECTEGYIYTFRMVENGRKLSLVHKTSVNGCPGAMCAFQGRVLVGVGKLLRIYDMGKRKLLRKCENKNMPNHIVQILSLGNRIYVADVQESFHFVKYSPDENRMVIYADDTTPRWVVTACLIDYSTVAGADKFGNVFILRLPASASDDISDDPSGAKVATKQRGHLNGAPQKLECLVNYHVGEMIVSLQKVRLLAGGGECIVYTTIRGTIGVLAPFNTREDVDFFQIMEMHMQQKNPPLCGRDHLAYRSYYFPRKNVIDGDLCEQFNVVSAQTRTEIAEETSRTSAEVSKKLENLRASFAF